MKKALKLMAMLLCVVSLASLSSCSKDDENGSGSNNIIGKWEVTIDTWNNNGNDFGHDSRVGEIWEFKDGGIVIADGQSVSYAVSGNDITLMGGMLSGSITSLTNSKLVLDLTVAMRMDNNPYPTEHIEFSKI